MRSKIPTRSRAAGKIRWSPMRAASSLLAERKARSSKLNLLEQEVISLPSRLAVEHRATRPCCRQARQAQQAHSDHRGPRQLSEGSQNPPSGRKKSTAKLASWQRSIRCSKPTSRTPKSSARGSPSATRSIDEGKAKIAEVRADIARVGDSKGAAQQVLEIGSIGGDFSELLRAMRAQLPIPGQLERDIWERDQAHRRRAPQAASG